MAYSDVTADLNAFLTSRLYPGQRQLHDPALFTHEEALAPGIHRIEDCPR